MSKENVEQLEAHEIDAVPRVVVTADGIFTFPAPGGEIRLSKGVLKSLLELGEELSKGSKTKRN